MSIEPPEGWRSGRISELVAEVTERIDPQAVADPNMPYLGLEDIGQGSGTVLSVGRARDATSQKSCFLSGDILFGKLRPNLKKVVRPDFDGICSTDISVFRANSHVAPDFAFRVLSSDPVIEQAVAHSAGTKMPRAHARSILSFETIIPPFDEQERIAEVLRSIGETIACLARTCDAYEQLRAAEVEAFASVSLRGDTQALGSLISTMDSGWSPDCDGDSALADMWGVLKTSAVTWQGFDDRQNKRLPTELLPRPNLEVSQNDILITRAGPAERTGVVALVKKTDGKRMLSDKLIRIRAREELIVPLALAELLRSEAVQEQFRALKSGMAASQTNISQEALRSVAIPRPSREEQASFVVRVANLDAALDGERGALSAMRNLYACVSGDLLSGRVRVPTVSSEASTFRAVQPAFKRAVFAAEVVYQLHRDNRFGSVKHEKIVHLCELHLGLQKELDRHAYKEAAGPYDPKARRSVESIFRQQKWFDPTKQDNRIVYSPLEAAGSHAPYFERYFGNRRTDIQALIDLLRPMTTAQCEIVATLYSVWNDFLVDGHQPSDDEIVAGVLHNWTDSKRQIAEERWRAALPWMRGKNLVPAGRGEKTRVTNK